MRPGRKKHTGEGSRRGDLDAAAEHVFALSSGELFTVLTGDLGWSGEAYEAWLAETLIVTLLA